MVLDRASGEGDPRTQIFHNKFKLLMVYSQVEPDLVVDSIFVEKEMIECMEDDQ